MSAAIVADVAFAAAAAGEHQAEIDGVEIVAVLVAAAAAVVAEVVAAAVGPKPVAAAVAVGAAVAAGFSVCSRLP